MKQYMITKTMTATLIVDCANDAEASRWKDRIVATLEDESGNAIPPQRVVDFEASCSPADSSVKIVKPSERI
jgi:hypothetical protein